jgi:hypothetical protein
MKKQKTFLIDLNGPEFFAWADAMLRADPPKKKKRKRRRKK